MKAAQISEFGGPKVVKVVDVDKPALKEGQVLVEVYASSLNPFDTTVRSGKITTFALPATLGGDIAGVITEVDAGVIGFATGDKVYGQANAVAGNSGAFAEFAATSAGQIAKKPSNIDWQLAGALPLVGISALQAVTEHINLQARQKILIHGGTGGIGSIAVQIAKHIGAYVAATVATESVDMAKKLGVDEVIDYQTQNFTDIIHDYDAVFNTASADMLEKSLPVLKPGGIVVSMIGQIDEALTQKYQVTALVQSTKVNTERLNKLTTLVEANVVSVHVDSVFPLDQIQDAFRKREGGGVFGKVAIEIKKV